MKKIAIVLFAAIALTSCVGGEAKCEGSNCDSTSVVAPVADSLAPVADTLAVDTTAVVTPTVK
jgi:hypothetical protein